MDLNLRRNTKELTSHFPRCLTISWLLINVNFEAILGILSQNCLHFFPCEMENLLYNLKQFYMNTISRSGYSIHYFKMTIQTYTKAQLILKWVLKTTAVSVTQSTFIPFYIEMKNTGHNPATSPHMSDNDCNMGRCKKLEGKLCSESVFLSVNFVWKQSAFLACRETICRAVWNVLLRFRLKSFSKFRKYVCKLMPEKWIPGRRGSARAIYRGKSPDLTEGVHLADVAPGKPWDREEDLVTKDRCRVSWRVRKTSGERRWVWGLGVSQENGKMKR